MREQLAARRFRIAPALHRELVCACAHRQLLPMRAFSLFGMATLRAVAALFAPRELLPAERVYSAGHRGDELFLVTQGEVCLTLTAPCKPYRLVPGGPLLTTRTRSLGAVAAEDDEPWFGASALLVGSPVREADAVALSRCQCLVLPREHLPQARRRPLRQPSPPPASARLPLPLPLPAAASALSALFTYSVLSTLSAPSTPSLHHSACPFHPASAPPVHRSCCRSRHTSRSSTCCASVRSTLTTRYVYHHRPPSPRSTL